METNKRGWIKNLIIIFLVLILIFTLFSNTFMNRSLPEVAVSNSESGTITTQVKLTGTVNANSVKPVTLEYARKINEVFVRRGDTVTPGTVLATLVAGASTEIDNLEIELKQLQIEYKKMLVETEDTITTLRYQLEDAEKELAELNDFLAAYPTADAQKQAYADQIKVMENQIKAYEDKIEARNEEIDAKKDDLDAKQEVIDDLQKQINKLHDAGMTLEKLGKAIKDAEQDVKDAEKATRRAKTALTSAESAANTASLLSADALKKLNEANAALEKAEKTLSDLNAKKDSLVSEREALDARIAELEAKPDRTEAEEAELSEKKTRLAAVRSEISDTNAAIKTAETAVADAESVQTAAAADSEKYAGQLQTANSARSAADAEYKSRQAEEKSAKTTLDNLNEGWSRALLEDRLAERQSEYDAVAKEQKLLNKDVEKMTKEKEKLTKEKTELETDSTTFEEKTKKQVELTRSVADCKTKLRIAEANGTIDDETEALNLSIQRTKIAQKQREIEKMREKAVSTEIKSTVSGTISTLNMTAGDEIAAGTTVAEIATSDGYTMECSVPNAQASRLRVGLVGEVQYYYWGDKPTVTIQTIKNDPNNSGKSKIVTLTVDGDVADGTSLTVTIGSQGSSYDCIVPNSAIQEDSDGKFILVVTSKSSPLGNRYYAQRKNVTVLASEATRSAIDASLSWGDYVITGATDADGKKIPISDGMQVRMAEK